MAELRLGKEYLLFDSRAWTRPMDECTILTVADSLEEARRVQARAHGERTRIGRFGFSASDWTKTEGTVRLRFEAWED